MHWKFLLFGITGNLAKIKILPGLAEFAALNQGKVSVELIGYSRSLPNLEEIEKSLNSGLQKNSNQTSQSQAKNQLENKPENQKNLTQNFTHNLTNITFEQGNYEDGRVLFENIAKLKTDERLVVYLAVPPSTFLKFLQNACPYSDQNVDFIIEKPFGRDTAEALKLLNLVENCGLERQVHFCDHYLFKNSTLLTSSQKTEIKEFFENQNLEQNIEQNQAETKEVLKTGLENQLQNQLKNINLNSQNSVKNPINKLDKIHIQILESVDLKGRSGYFDTTGAIKDMWPHLFSLLFLTLENAGFETDFEMEVCEVFLGQYQSYADEEGLSDSKTETYFWIKLKVQQNGNLQQNNSDKTNKTTEIILESGKNLPKKITQMTLYEKFGKNLNWSIYPHENITLSQKLQKEAQFNSQNQNSLESQIKSSQNQSSQLDDQIINLKRQKQDQTNLFELLLAENKKRFVESVKIKKSWDWWQKITDFIIENNIQIEIYPDQTLPKLN